MTKLSRRHCLLSLSATTLTVWPVSEALASPFDAVPDAKRVGHGRYTYLGFDVFDATLYAPGGVYNPNQPFALELHYLRPIKATDIVKRSITEIRRQGFKDNGKLAEWRTQMAAIFPDVGPDASILGVRRGDGASHFYHNRGSIGSIADSEFSRQFFDIWLGAKSSSKALRAKLLGDA